MRICIGLHFHCRAFDFRSVAVLADDGLESDLFTVFEQVLHRYSALFGRRFYLTGWPHGTTRLFSSSAKSH